MTNEQIENYINGKGGEELLARGVWVAHLQWPQETGVAYRDGEIREPKVKVTKECVSEVLIGECNDVFCAYVDAPPDRRTRTYWIRVMNDSRLYYPYEVYLTKEEAMRVARRKVLKMTAKFRSSLIEEVKTLNKRVDYTQKRIKLLKKWIAENKEAVNAND